MVKTHYDGGGSIHPSFPKEALGKLSHQIALRLRITSDGLKSMITSCLRAYAASQPDCLATLRRESLKWVNNVKDTSLSIRYPGADAQSFTAGAPFAQFFQEVKETHLVGMWHFSTGSSVVNLATTLAVLNPSKFGSTYSHKAVLDTPRRETPFSTPFLFKTLRLVGVSGHVCGPSRLA